MIVAADAEAEQEGQIPHCAEIEPDIGEIGPRDRADDDEVAASPVLKRSEQLADLAPFQPGVRKAIDLLVGLAADAENMHAAALRHRGLGKRGGKCTATGDDGERTSVTGARVGLGLGHLSFGSALGHCCSGRRKSGRSET